MPSLIATEFEAERPRLLAVAYRMLGSRAEAEDAVQEAWLRYAKARDGGEIHDLRGWLTTVTGRICLDVLKSARVSRTAYPGQWLPSYVVEPDAGPSERAEMSDQIAMALLVVLEKLSPEQRVALVLHDAFGMPFDDVATVLGTTENAARQHASRGRRAVAQDTIRHTADLAEQRRVLGAFMAAANGGDLQALAALLAPDVVAIGDGGGLAPGVGSRPIVGAEKVARFYLGIAAGLGAVQVETVLVNGSIGLLARGKQANGRPLCSVLAVAVDNGRITGFFNQLNPSKLDLRDLE
jgi:RNA polymerase sigma-70 factor (ECF subfamily)